MEHPLTGWRGWSHARGSVPSSYVSCVPASTGALREAGAEMVQDGAGPSQAGSRNLGWSGQCECPWGGGSLGGLLEVADPRPRACARVRPGPATSQGPAAQCRPSRRPAPALHRPHLLRRACQDSTSRLRPHGNRGAGVLLPLALGLVSIRASLLSSGLPLTPAGASSHIY